MAAYTEIGLTRQPLHSGGIAINPRSDWASMIITVELPLGRR